MGLEISNDWFSKLLLLNLNTFELLFLRNIFSILFLIFIPKQLNQHVLSQIFIVCGFFYSVLNYNLPLSLVYGYLFLKYCKNQTIILRSLFTFLAFVLTTTAMQNLNITNISMSYYSIPIFSSILSILLLKEGFNKVYILEILILSIFIFTNFNITACVMLAGCFCFSMCDILIKTSKNTIISEVFYLSILMSFFLSLFCQKNTIISLINKTNNLKFLFILITGNILLQILIFVVFQRISFRKLLPLRFLSLLLCNILERRYFSPINFLVFLFILIEFWFSWDKNK